MRRKHIATLTIGVLSILTLLASAAGARADLITDWNLFGLERMSAAKLPAGAPLRGMAMLHAAIFDATNAIAPRYAPYAGKLEGEAGASQAASVCAAAFITLLSVIPTEAEALSTRYNACLVLIPDGREKTQGVAIGARAANAVIALRGDDGADFSSDYKSSAGVGAYAPLTMPVVAPHFASMRPFVLKRSDALRPPPPPTIGSPQSERDLAETQALGGADSSLRSAEQTAQAHYFAFAARIVWNSIARQAIEARGLDLTDSARVMALVNFALSDSSSVVWDAKYFYNAWRPQTALQAAAPGWKPLEPDPLHPEYPCAHCGNGSAVSTVLQSLFGEQPIPFTVSVGQGAQMMRSFTSFRAFEIGEAQSRLYIGAHFRWSIIVGEALGRQVGDKVLEALKPLK